MSTIPFYGPVVIKTSYMGYKSKLDTIRSSESNLSVYLESFEFYSDEIVTTADFTGVNSSDAIQKIRVIGKDRIEKQNAFSLRELLTQEAGIQVSQDGILGTGVSINGVSGENVKIMIDGVPLVGRLDGNIDISQINMSNVERVEIIEGPMSALYGSDALGGVINIITKQQRSEDIDFSLNTRHEAVGGDFLMPHDGIYNFDASIGFEFLETDFRLNGGRNFFGGFDLDESQRSQAWNPKEQYFVDFSAGYSIGNKSRIKLQSNFFNETLIDYGNLIQPFEITAFDNHFLTNRWMSSLNFESTELGGNPLITTLSYSRFDRTRINYVKNLENLSQTPSADMSAHDTTVFDNIMLRTFYTLPEFSEHISIQTGFEGNLDNAYGERIENGGQEIVDLAGFVSTSFNFSGFEIQPAARFIYNSLYEAPIIPSLNLKYSFDDVILRGSVAQGFRAPSIKELYLLFVDVNHNIIGNSNLQAENSVSANLNVDWQTLSGSLDNPWLLKISGRGFYNQINDMITLAMDANDPQLFSYFNLDNFTSVGAGINSSLFYSDFQVNTDFVVIGRTNSLTGNDLHFTPEATLGLTYTYKPWGITASTNTKYTGTMPLFVTGQSGEIENGFMQDFTMTDLSLAYKVYEGWSINAGVRNLFDVQNLQSSVQAQGGVHSSGSSSQAFAWGRSLYFGFSFR
ncbi:MAG: hypothetical protein Kapaf2KO_16190 [Candidatus Kapaibacteriales bacterium]